ncbi:MAG: hypothetical protein MMC33_007144 [Icmadophila ericetorum]|nr:hypothetical protein [Icmadophila ericetorum]
MSWFSILPPALASLETWLIRIFLLLGILTIGPWALLILYDLVLYILRTAAYEFPIVGGRARGAQRPRAPSLMERPGGQPRRFSVGVRSGGGGDGGSGSETEGTRANGGVTRERKGLVTSGD